MSIPPPVPTKRQVTEADLIYIQSAYVSPSDYDKEGEALRHRKLHRRMMKKHGKSIYQARAAWSEPKFTRKIRKDKGAKATDLEASVGLSFLHLEGTTIPELKSEIKDLYINSAVQINVSGNRKAVLIQVPYRLRKRFRKIHVSLVRELEKILIGKDVIIIATRRIVRPPKKGSAAQRPRSRTLTAVHEAILEDIVLPAEIVGKRTRYRIDGSKIMKVFLDPKAQNHTEYKLETFAAVYRKLSGKDVVFEYPVTEA